MDDVARWRAVESVRRAAEVAARRRAARARAAVAVAETEEAEEEARLRATDRRFVEAQVAAAEGGSSPGRSLLGKLERAAAFLDRLRAEREEARRGRHEAGLHLDAARRNLEQACGELESAIRARDAAEAHGRRLRERNARERSRREDAAADDAHLGRRGFPRPRSG